jgi:hypothetical protein
MDPSLHMEEFPSYLERHRLADPRHIPFIRRWVERFLSGTHHPGLAWEDRVREYVAALQQHPGLADWQIRQAEVNIVQTPERQFYVRDSSLRAACILSRCFGCTRDSSA